MDGIRLVYLLYPSLWYSALIVIGLCVGSFLNVLIYRIPIIIAQNDTEEIYQPGSKKGTLIFSGFNLLYPSSHCPHCHSTVLWRDNVPVISWLFLRGKSRCCNKAIGITYPLVELTTAGITLLCGVILPPGLPLLGLMIFTWGMVTLTVIDSRTYLLPDIITYPLLWTGILFNLNECFIPLKDAIMGAVAGYMVMWFFNIIVTSLIRKRCMGNGDLKMIAAIAAWTGWQSLPNLLLCSAIAGIIYIFLANRMAGRNMNIAIPFGPFLAMSGFMQIYLTLNVATL